MHEARAQHEYHLPVCLHVHMDRRMRPTTPVTLSHSTAKTGNGGVPRCGLRRTSCSSCAFALRVWPSTAFCCRGMATQSEMSTRSAQPTSHLTPNFSSQGERSSVHRAKDPLQSLGPLESHPHTGQPSPRADGYQHGCLPSRSILCSPHPTPIVARHRWSSPGYALLCRWPPSSGCSA